MLRTLQKTAVRVCKAGTSQPHKGKQPTKGFQQIVHENAETVLFYRNIILGLCLLRPVLSIALSGQLSLTGITIGSIMSTIIIPILLIFLLNAMGGHALPLYNNSVELRLIYPGHDLGLPGGLGDHIKDVIVVLVLTHVLTATSPQFWCILLLLPMKALYLAWIYIIRPALVLFLRSGDKQCGKKAKKHPKKSKRHKYHRTITHWHHFR